jgi:hypothetical protein
MHLCQAIIEPETGANTGVNTDGIRCGIRCGISSGIVSGVHAALHDETHRGLWLSGDCCQVIDLFFFSLDDSDLYNLEYGFSVILIFVLFSKVCPFCDGRQIY